MDAYRDTKSNKKLFWRNIMKNLPANHRSILYKRDVAIRYSFSNMKINRYGRGNQFYLNLHEGIRST